MEFLHLNFPHRLHLIHFLSFSIIFLFSLYLIYIPASNASDDDSVPRMVVSNLKVELVFRGLDFPTTMAFIGPDDILVLEKEKGTVQRIVDGKMSEEPLLDVDVSYKD